MREPTSQKPAHCPPPRYGHERGYGAGEECGGPSSPWLAVRAPPHAQNIFGPYLGLSQRIESGEINLPLICDWPNRPLQKVDHDVGKSALTNWKIIEKFQDYSIVKLTPKTGRSHQLRVHMNELGHPILGDRLYAHDKAFNTAPRLCLHAHTLEFHNPTGGERITCFTAPCPF